MTNRCRPVLPEHETREESRRRYEEAADASLAMYEKAHPMQPATPGHAALNTCRAATWPVYLDSRGNLWSAVGSFLGRGAPPDGQRFGYVESYLP